GFEIEWGRPNLAHNTHDLPLRFRPFASAELQVFSDWVLPGPVITRHGFANHGDWWRIRAILSGDKTPLEQRHAQSSEEVRGNSLRNRRRHLSRRRRRLPFGTVFRPVPSPTGRHAGHASH